MRDPATSPKGVAEIAGCGAITAVGRGVEALRSALHANTSGLKPSGRFDHQRFQSQIVGAVVRDHSLAEEYDNPGFYLATTALQEAREEAKEILNNIPPARIGLVFATTKANVEALERVADGRPCSTAARRHIQGDLLAQDLASTHDAGGPVQTVSVACVSGLVGLQQGAKMIERGQADAVLVVGADHLSSFVVAGFSALKALDPAGCRPFDQNRCGLSPGEAGAAIVLARSGMSGRKGITLRGWGTSNDANHMTGPSRDGAGLALAIHAALKSAGVDQSDIDYINAHGTGTPYNDAMELQALRSVFGETCPPMSGLKGMLGHTLGAAGVIETIACVLAMRDNFLPGTPRLQSVTEGAPKELVQTPRAARRMKNVLKLNVGFGGVNGALVLRHE